MVEPRRDRPLLLVVDDQLFMRRTARDWLEEAGFAVEEAENGAQAVEMCRRLRPDLILLDAVMPVMDGFEACAALRALPGGRHTPILMMTGLDDAESIRRAYGAGATDFIHKPINGLVLGYRVRYMLRASQTAEELRKSEAKLAHAQRIASLAYWDLEVQTGRCTASEELHRILGVWPEVFGSTWDALLGYVHPGDRGAVETLPSRVQRDREPRSADFRIVRPDGTERIVHQQAEPPRADSGDPTHVTGTVQDITELRRAEEQIHFLAYFDALTRLPNRRSALDRINALLSRAKRRAGWVAVLLVGVDHFKRVNDTLGHAAGDQLLQVVAERLLECLTGTRGAAPEPGVELEPFVGRFGGDEFSVFLSDVARVEDVARVARRIAGALKRPFSLRGQELSVTASIGISLFPFDGSDAEILLRNAATALSHAKSQRSSEYQFYAQAMNATVLSEFILESHLRKAVEREEFTLHYQPQMDLASGGIVGAEALIRWYSPELGLVMPLEFIPLAEKTELIYPIGEWVLRTACLQAKGWQEAGLPPLRVAVNVSARQFGKNDFTQTVARAFRSAGLDPLCLDLELTESTVMEDVDSAIGSLRELKGMGLTVSVDDFGTGYSSLSYLRRFPLDALKIDRSFLPGLPGDPEHTAITRAIIEIAKSLNLRVIAEGVEDGKQLAYLREKGCDEAQGNHLSFPIPSEDFVRLAQTGKPLS